MIRATVQFQAYSRFAFVITMEHLFSPCTRLHDILDSRSLLEEVPDPEGWLELNLNVSTEELLSVERAFTYADLYAMLGNADTVAWLTPHAAVARKDGSAMYAWEQLDDFSCFRFRADGKSFFALARSSEHLLDIVDVVVRLLTLSIVQSVSLTDGYSLERVFINAPTLAYLMEQCQSLKVLKLCDLNMNENHCRVLGDFSKPDLEIVLHHCEITSAGANVMAEVLGRNRGPTKLYRCEIDYVVLAGGLRGNSRLKSLSTNISSSADDGNREVLAIAGALRENKGLVDLDLTSFGFRLSDEAWDAYCDSLKAHPTLEVLNPRTMDAPLAPSVIKSRLQKLVDMMKVNMSIHTLHLDDRYCQHELFRESVIPYLETNRFRPRLLAIQKTRPIAYRAKVLGRALLSARTNANSVWMLLSGNAEVALL
jgi:hypothetical protein